MFLWDSKRTALSCVCILGLLLSGMPALASGSPPALPGSIDPSKIGGQARQGVPALNGQPETGSPVQSADLVIPGADQVLFTLVDLKISGMQAYEQGRFLADYVTLIGRPVTLQQVIDVVNTINRTYREDGYIFSKAFLPEQDITSGVVQVQVVEAGIDTVSLPKVSAEKFLLLKPYADKISSIRPFNINKYEHWLLTLNQLPGAKFRSVLKQPEGGARPGAIEVVIFEDQLPAQGVAELNNFGSRYAGPIQTSLAYDRPRVFGAYDQMGLRLSATLPTEEVAYGQISYRAPLMSIPGLSLNGSIGWGGTESGSNLDSLDVKGYVREMRLGVSYAALMSRRTNWLVDLNLDFKNARSKLLGEELYDDRLRAIRLSTVFQHIDDFDGVTLMNAELSKGLDIMGARETGSFNLSREDGHSDFTKVTAQISRLQALPRHFKLLAQISGQYAFSPLLSAEEFGHGGVPSGRGYDPSEITGDHGVNATLELRYGGVPQWHDLQVQPYAFVDFGKVWQKGDDAENAVSALSTGFGSRIDYLDTLSMNALVAVPLTLSADNPPKYANGGSPRYLLSVSRRF